MSKPSSVSTINCGSSSSTTLCFLAKSRIRRYAALISVVYPIVALTAEIFSIRVSSFDSLSRGFFLVKSINIGVEENDIAIFLNGPSLSSDAMIPIEIARSMQVRVFALPLILIEGASAQEFIEGETSIIGRKLIGGAAGGALIPFSSHRRLIFSCSSSL